MTTTEKMTKIPPAPKWDLDSIFKGGSNSPEYKQHREDVKKRLEKAEKNLPQLQTGIDDASIQTWVDFILEWESLGEDIELILSFAGCLTAQNTKDSLADAIESEGMVYYSRWQKIKATIESLASQQTDENWKKVTQHEKLKEIEFFLNELRDSAKDKMPLEMESLALELSVNGIQAWDQLYSKMSGELEVEFEENGTTTKMSLGQLATKMSDSNRDVRKQAFEKMVEAWESRENLAAMTLNALAGFRLSLYERRGWESVTYEALKRCRMEQKTLDTMWKVIKDNLNRLKPYIDAKKKLLNIDKFRWYDQFAPCGDADKLYSYDEAADFVYENIRSFSPDMAAFCKLAFDKNWIEAEDRPNKRGGGFCTGMGKHGQSRIFMTYAGTYENLLTLAHELGHAYHSWVLKEKQPFAQDYPMNLAETASTFAEAVVTDAALANTEDPQEKLMLLEQKLQGAYTFMCDIHSRYIFDKNFHERRKEGVLSTQELKDLMIAAQKEAYGDLLDESGYHPLFWCSKLHFYISSPAFYNFPYTFGFMYSGGLYDRAKKEGESFAAKYDALLADTGTMTAEALTQKHLGVDLTEEAFWQGAVDTALADVDEFVKLVKELS